MVPKKYKHKSTYNKCVIICHGKSELILANHLRSNLKLPIAIYSEQNGKSNIQITSLKRVLGNTAFKNKSAFCDYFGFENQKGKDVAGKIFVVMDLDDADEKQIEDFKSKKMFDNHWAKDMIVPIWNIPNFDYVMYDLGLIKELPNDKSKGRLYNNAFPIKRDGKQDIDKIKELRDICKKNKNTNMEEMLDWLLKLANEDLQGN